MLQIRYRYLITKMTLIYKYFRNIGQESENICLIAEYF